MTTIDKIKNGETVRRLITYQGKRVLEQIQPNKKEPGCWSRFMLPTNGDKSQAIMHNYALTENEVIQLLTTKT